MKIIVAILANENYLLKITNAFIQKYSDFKSFDLFWMWKALYKLFIEVAEQYRNDFVSYSKL